MTRLASWPNVFSVLAVVSGGPILLWLGVSDVTVVVALGTFIALIQVVSHLIGTYRVGQAL
jgi:hypothetical protein